MNAGGQLFHGQVKKFHGALKEATVWKYFGDGSGRDSYVVKDSGGLIPEYPSRSPQSVFYQGLRNYTKSNRSLKNKFTYSDANGHSVANSSQPWFTSGVKNMLNRQSKIQKVQSERLSTPKSATP